AISSNARIPSRSNHGSPSAGMQYWQRKLQRSVTETRTSPIVRPWPSRRGSRMGRAYPPRRGERSGARLERHVEHDEDQEDELDARDEEQPSHARERLCAVGAVALDVLAELARLRAEEADADDEREQPDDQREDDPALHVPVALADEQE